MRLKQLQIGNPTTLTLHNTIESPRSKELEKELHKQLEDKHIRGEWFKMTEEEIDEVVATTEAAN